MRYFILVLALLGGLHVLGQNNVAAWRAQAKQVKAGVYDIYLIASFRSPRYTYSCTTPEGGPQATQVRFMQHPLVTLVGHIREIGSILTKYEEVFEVHVKYVDGPAELVQRVAVKGNVKTTLSGSIELMACDDTRCLPPSTYSFTVSLI